MSADRDPVHAAVDALYAAFASYPAPSAVMFCTFCNTDDEIAYLVATEVRAIAPEPARSLLWETGDHWGTADAYKHYLPRVLEALAPPERCDDIYPAHLFEVLAYHHVAAWPATERSVVHACLEQVTSTLAFDSAEDAEAWRAAVRALAAPPAAAR